MEISDLLGNFWGHSPGTFGRVKRVIFGIPQAVKVACAVGSLQVRARLVKIRDNCFGRWLFYYFWRGGDPLNPLSELELCPFLLRFSDGVLLLPSIEVGI